VGGEQFANWVVDLLAWIDQPNLANAWDHRLPRDHPANRPLAQTGIPLLVCPADRTAVAGAPNLSYVVNGGIAWTVPVDCPVTLHVAETPPRLDIPLDLNGNGIVCPSDPAEDGQPNGQPNGQPDDRLLMFRLGMFFGENEPPGSGTLRHHRAATISDGLSNTIMLSENIRAGYDPDVRDTGWSDALARRNSFFLSAYVCANETCSPGNVDYRYANHRASEPHRFEAINGSLTQAEGQAPWPSSDHPQGVFFLFADGHVKFVSEEIEGGVYARLLSPQGARIRGPLRQ
jgi:prepilin-type processing-associated H-X9-DG protein